MNSLQHFLSEPWKQTSLHISYKESFLHITPSPEVATGEILLASLYRNVGFQEDSEVGEKVWKLGTPFRKQLEKGKRPRNGYSKVGFDSNLWNTVINQAIASPNLSGQSNQRGRQLSPVVPDTTLYSMSARLKGNPWNPGKLIAQMIALGTSDYDKALEIWQSLFDKLSVTDEDDDIWARMLQSEFESWRADKILNAWSRPNSFPYDVRKSQSLLSIDHPSKCFIDDLKVVLDLKQSLTRRQWISLLESLCRIGACAHITWLCHANDQSRILLEDALETGKVLDEKEVAYKLSTDTSFWRLGQRTTKPTKEAARRYIEGRGALNLMLHTLEQAGLDMSQVSLETSSDIAKTLSYLASQKNKFNFSAYLDNFNQMMENDPRIAECKKGSAKNVLEFLEHITRQRITSEAGLESYDRGYYVEKRGNYANAPWVSGLGPLSILLMVHCADNRVTGPCTVKDLCHQLARYGIDAEMASKPGESLNRKLREMSIVVDSPDAEGGMVIISPLDSARKEEN